MKSDDGRRHFPLGRGMVGAEKLGGVSPEKVIEMPMSIHTNDSNEDGTPLTLERPVDAALELQAYERLAKEVSAELLKTFYGTTESSESVSFQDSSEEFSVATVDLSLDSTAKEFVIRLYSPNGAILKRVRAAQLRARDPKTGDVIEESPFLEKSGEKPAVHVHKSGDRISPSVDPSRVDRKGRYGFAVKWADGATIIYSKQSIAIAAGGLTLPSTSTTAA